MKSWKLRAGALALAVEVAFAGATPALAATPRSESGGIIQTLLDVPVLGDILRLFGAENGPATAETATAETATAETATAETATPETGNTETPQDAGTDDGVEAPATGLPVETVTWPAAWMTGAVAPGVPYPMGSPDAEAPETPALWGTVGLTIGVSSAVANREETNLGDLVADAAGYAAAAWLSAQPATIAADDPLPRALPTVSLVPGRCLTGSTEAGASLAEVAGAVADEPLAAVAVTPKKLKAVVEEALRNMLDSESAEYGGFPQVSGIRLTYESAGAGNYTLTAAALADLENAEGTALDLADDTTQLLLVLPESCLEPFELYADAGYDNLLAGAGLTLAGAITALPQNCDAATLEALLARQGTAGRIQPSTAASFDAVVELGSGYANLSLRFLVDGVEMRGQTDGNGTLTIAGLSAGGHTLRMAAGEPAYYISNVTHIGTAGGSPVTVAALPESAVVGPAATPTPTPTETPAPTAAPTSTPAATATPTPAPNNDSHGDDGGDEAPAPTETPAPPTVVTTTTAPAPTKRPVKVTDPTAGTTQATPVPTLEPTPTPTPTPAPTRSPEEEAVLDEAETQSSRLPLYVGIALGVACVAVIAGVVIKRKFFDGNGGGNGGSTYRRRNR